MENFKKYKKSGQLQGAVGAVIYLIVGVGVSVLVLIFVGTLGGQTYTLTQGQIANITDNTTRGYVTSSIQSGFQALSQTGQYLPIIVLAIVIAIVLSLVLGFTALGGNAGRGGSAL
jgi:hypothetical protein